MTAPTDFVEVPSGALCGATITLTCKGPDEERSYVIEYDSQLDPDDYIVGPITWESSDPAMSVTNATSYGRRFRFTLNGGTLNQKSGVTLKLPLKSGDVRTLTCVLTIEAQGVLETGTIPVIMGSQGQRGVTMFTGNDDPTASYMPPSGWVILNNDLYLNETSNTLFRATVATDGTVAWTKITQLGTSSQIDPDSVITTPTNTITLGALVDQSVLATKITDYFYITAKGNLAIKSDLISDSDPDDADALWYNGDFLTRSDG